MGPRQSSQFASCSQSISILQLKIGTVICTMAPVDSNQLGTGKWIPCDMVGIIPTITLLCGLLALHIGAREFRLISKYSSQEIHDHHGLLA